MTNNLNSINHETCYNTFSVTGQFVICNLWKLHQVDVAPPFGSENANQSHRKIGPVGKMVSLNSRNVHPYHKLQGWSSGGWLVVINSWFNSVSPRLYIGVRRPKHYPFTFHIPIKITPQGGDFGTQKLLRHVTDSMTAYSRSTRTSIFPVTFVLSLILYFHTYHGHDIRGWNTWDDRGRKEGEVKHEAGMIPGLWCFYLL